MPVICYLVQDHQLPTSHLLILPDNQQVGWHAPRKAAGNQLAVAWNVQFGLMAGTIYNSFILQG